MYSRSVPWPGPAEWTDARDRWRRSPPRVATAVIYHMFRLQGNPHSGGHTCLDTSKNRNQNFVLSLTLDGQT